MQHLLIDHFAWLLNGRLSLVSTSSKGKSVILTQSVKVENTTDDVTTHLQQLLMQAPRGRLHLDSLSLHVGAPWIHYAVLPWQEGLNSAPDWDGYAKLMMSQHFSANTDSWRVSVFNGKYGEQRVAAAIDGGLYEVVMSLAKAQKLRVTCFDTMLFSSIDHYAGRLNDDAFVIILLEHGFMSCAFWDNGNWQGIETLPLDTHGVTGPRLAASVRDAAMLSGIESLARQVYVCVCDEIPPQIEGMQGFLPVVLGRPPMYQEFHAGSES